MAMTTMGRPITPMQWTMGTCSELLLTTPVLTSTHLVATTHHAQQPTWKPHSTEKLFNAWNVGSIKGVTSAVLVPRWCVVYGIVCILRYFCEHPGCGGLVWVRCMRVRVVLITPASVPLFYLQTSETFKELTMRAVILNGHSKMLLRRLLSKWLVYGGR